MPSRADIDYEYRTALRAAQRHLERAERLAERLSREGARAHISYHRLALAELSERQGPPKRLPGQLDILTALSSGDVGIRS